MAMMEILTGLSRLFLGFVFMSAGGLKVFMETPLLAREWGSWVADQPSFGVRVLGVVEAFVGLVLVIPLVLDAPGELTNIGAFGVILVMGVAMFENLRIGRTGSALLNVALAAVAAFVILTHNSGQYPGP